MVFGIASWRTQSSGGVARALAGAEYSRHGLDELRRLRARQPALGGSRTGGVGCVLGKYSSLYGFLLHLPSCCRADFIVYKQGKPYHKHRSSLCPIKPRRPSPGFSLRVLTRGKRCTRTHRPFYFLHTVPPQYRMCYTIIAPHPLAEHYVLAYPTVKLSQIQLKRTIDLATAPPQTATANKTTKQQRQERRAHLCMAVHLSQSDPTLALPVGHHGHALNLPLVARATPNSNEVSLRFDVFRDRQ